ncbi:MAG: nucleoside triphosphate pyrophosphohydrolase [Chloroflexota bacterium]|nr:nucleoside triphosphate pyrophosphohydrolase [Chloroflexota bacterium]
MRDLVPQQLAAKGVAAQVSRYDDAAYLEALRAKLVEESIEYSAARDDGDAVAELADVLEVVLALAAVHGAAARTWRRRARRSWRPAAASPNGSGS